jgi:carboxylesterase type B
MFVSCATIAPTLLFVLASLAQDDNLSPTVTITGGRLRGTTTRLPESDIVVNQYLGIPYAQPPIENLRFAPPESPESWSDTLDATQQPNGCMQYYGPPGPSTDMSMELFNTPGPPGESEDCLYLNVYTPQGGDNDKPVLFWLHGGSGTTGAASEPIYDGSIFAASHDIVVVTINYRLNVFGSPRAPMLEENSLARLDQRMALNWVQENIQSFSGDASKGMKSWRPSKFSIH